MLSLRLREAHLRMTEPRTHEGKPEMSVIAAQVSLYPLREDSIGPGIRDAVREIRGRGLKTRVGKMNTLV